MSASDAEGNTDRWTLTAAGRLRTWRRAGARRGLLRQPEPAAL
nr:hypothetical protein [Cronobacter sakazakii]